MTNLGINHSKLPSCMQENGNKADDVFNEEFLPHGDALLTFAYHLTYDEAQAEDLVQETFMKAWRFIDSYQRGTNAKAWLFKILKNAFINDYRKKAKRPHSVDYEDFLAYHDSEDSSYKDLDTNNEVFQGMMGDEVTKALNDLPVNFKTVILLCDIEGFTYEEMSAIIGIRIGTIRSRLHRARNMLKDALQGYAANLGYTEKEH